MKPVPGLPIEQQPEPVVFACALCGEARGDGRPGMEAVAQVVMNRVNHANAHARQPLIVFAYPDGMQP